MSRRAALAGVSAALRGRVAPGVDWVEVVTLANHALVTPAMFRALEESGGLAEIPEDVTAYIAGVTQLNDERNRRLLTAFADAVGALNGAGIEPVLLKGMALWAARGTSAAPFARMMADIDLLVRPAEVARAVEALREAGFDVLEQYEDPASHVAAELGRPSDVGAIDLHRRPPGPPYATRAFSGWDLNPREWRGRVRVPSPAQQIYLMCVHDQFHDAGYWRGGFDLRHLQDIAELTRSADPVDWAELERLTPTRLVRNAVHAELIAAREITGAKLPDSIAARPVPNLQFRRHRAQHLHPRWGLPLAGAGLLLELPNIAEHRSANRAGWRAVLDGSEDRLDRRWGYRPQRMKGLMKTRPGKI